MSVENPQRHGLRRSRFHDNVPENGGCHLGQQRGAVDRVRPRFRRRQVQRLALSVNSLRLPPAFHEPIENGCTYTEASGSCAPLALKGDR